MKLAIPVEENSMDSKINLSLGRANYFLIYDLKSNRVDYMENTGRDNKSGAGIEAGQLIVDSGAEILLAPKCGQKLARILEKAEFKIYKTEGFNIKENIEKYKREELSLLNDRVKS